MNKINKYIHISVRDATGEAVWNATEVGTWGATWYRTYNATEKVTWDVTLAENPLKSICYE